MIPRPNVQGLIREYLSQHLPDSTVVALVARLDAAIYEPRCAYGPCEVAAKSNRGGLCSKHLNRQERRGTLEDTATSHLTTEQRFWLNVDPKDPDACWEYQGCRHDHGYGLISTRYAHRFSYELHFGPFPQTLHVRHKCDNPPCVNPAHLELGTHADNMRDMANRGRASGGAQIREERKLTPEKVRAMRADSAAGVGPSEMQRRYGVTRTTIKHVITRQTWKDV